MTTTNIRQRLSEKKRRILVPYYLESLTMSGSTNSLSTPMIIFPIYGTKYCMLLINISILILGLRYVKRLKKSYNFG